MTTDRRAPVIRLLTAPEAAKRLGIALADIERLVDIGALAVLRVSARDGRRFWPADVDAAGARVSKTHAGVHDPAVATATSGATLDAGPVARRRPAGRRRSAPQRPRWAGFAFAPNRVQRVYLAFRDPEHIVGYLEARKVVRPGS